MMGLFPEFDMAPAKPLKTILSASRRTDIPAFYMEWFMAGIQKGFFDVINPYNQYRRRVPAHPHEVHSIVFWSKNFGPFLQGHYDRQLVQKGYRLFFNFTINAPSPELEPHVPPLAERLRQAKELARRFHPTAIVWRYDPICFFRRGKNLVSPNHIEAMDDIAEALAAAGIRRCVTSFVDLYGKVKRRMASHGVNLVDPPIALKCDTLMQMAAHLHPRGMALGACCEKDILDKLPTDAGIGAGDCIPGDILARLYGNDFTLQKDPGQRRKAGCTCNIAADIGSYRQQPCYHNCLFCYANPREPGKRNA